MSDSRNTPDVPAAAVDAVKVGDVALTVGDRVRDISTKDATAEFTVDAVTTLGAYLVDEGGEFHDRVTAKTPAGMYELVVPVSPCPIVEPVTVRTVIRGRVVEITAYPAGSDVEVRKAAEGRSGVYTWPASS